VSEGNGNSERSKLKALLLLPLQPNQSSSLR